MLKLCKSNILTYIGKFLSVFILFFAMSVSNSHASDVFALRVGQGVGNIRIVLDSNSDFKYEVFSLDNPRRLVLDVLNATVSKDIENQRIKSDIVSSIRVGEFSEGKTRIVLELKRPIIIKKTFSLPPQSSFSWRFVVDISVVSDRQFNNTVTNSSKGEVLSSSNTISISDAIKGILSEPANGRDDDDSSSSPEVIHSVTVKPAPKPVDKTPRTNNKKTKRVIVLDAGHGGKDPGAIGFSGVYEKNITLSMVKELKALLEKDSRYKVYLTRSNDTFISLRGRVNIARKHEADLFVSVHADSAQNRSAVGLSVYTLSENASDKEAAALAERENKVDIIAGLNLGEHSKEVSDILINLAQRETMNKSSEFATFMVDEMKRSVKLVANTHRFAGFAVLKAPDIPSVLLELGYLSNRREEALLKQKSYRIKLANSTKKAIDRYFASIE